MCDYNHDDHKIDELSDFSFILKPNSGLSVKVLKYYDSGFCAIAIGSSTCIDPKFTPNCDVSFPSTSKYSAKSVSLQISWVAQGVEIAVMSLLDAYQGGKSWDVIHMGLEPSPTIPANRAKQHIWHRGEKTGQEKDRMGPSDIPPPSSTTGVKND